MNDKERAEIEKMANHAMSDFNQAFRDSLGKLTLSCDALSQQFVACGQAFKRAAQKMKDARFANANRSQAHQGKPETGCRRPSDAPSDPKPKRGK